METLQKKLYRFIIPMTVLLPIWVAVGRCLFGVYGWLLLFTVLLVGPFLLLVLSVLAVLTLTRKEVRSSHILRPLEAKLYLMLYISAFVFGLTLVDLGDTEGSISSIMTKLFGSGLQAISMVLAVLSGLVAFGALAWLLVHELLLRRSIVKY